MFTDHGDMVYTLFVGMIFCYFMLLVLGLLSLKVIGNVVKIPGNILTPMILALCVVGTYALNNSLFDVGIMLIAGVVGYFMQKGGYPASPVVLALIMGPMAKVIFAVRCRFQGFTGLSVYPTGHSGIANSGSLYATDANNPQNNAFTASVTDIAPRSWGAFLFQQTTRRFHHDFHRMAFGLFHRLSIRDLLLGAVNDNPATIPARRP